MSDMTREQAVTDKENRKTNFTCISCMYCVPKRNTAKGDAPEMGKCRRNPPGVNTGFPGVYLYSDWCGEHKLGSNPIRDGNK